MLEGKRVLLIVAGGVAAYKSLEVVRLLRARGAAVRCVVTRAAAEFVAPLSFAALSGNKVYGDLFSLTDESEMGHIRLTREADAVVAAPATADLIARMAGGRANDLAAAALLASDKPVLVAPAMNARMWAHPAVRRNMALLESDGARRVGPAEGDLACGETGPGRMAEPEEIIAAIERLLPAAGPLAGVRALVTSGPTHEPIDPVRYIANRSSGKQGHAIARALCDGGAEVTLAMGPTAEPAPARAKTVRADTAERMLAACRAALPVDVAVCVAAVGDWRAAAPSDRKLKRNGAAARSLELAANPDILAALSAPGRRRPALVVGFAAETENTVANAAAKRAAKGCDWIVANDVSGGGVFGEDRNRVHVIDAAGVETWESATKAEVARRLAARIAAARPGGGAPAIPAGG